MSLHHRISRLLAKAQDSLFGGIKQNPNLKQEKRVVQGKTGPYLKTVYVRKDAGGQAVQDGLFGDAPAPAKPPAPKPPASASKPVQDSLFGPPASAPAAKPQPKPAPKPAPPAQAKPQATAKPAPQPPAKPAAQPAAPAPAPAPAPAAKAPERATRAEFRALSALAETGARLTPPKDDQPALVGSYLAQTEREEARVEVTPAVYQALSQHGWLEDAGQGTLKLSRAGKRAMDTTHEKGYRKSAPAPAAAEPQPAPEAAPAPAAPSAPAPAPEARIAARAQQLARAAIEKHQHLEGEAVTLTPATATLKFHGSATFESTYGATLRALRYGAGDSALLVYPSSGRDGGYSVGLERTGLTLVSGRAQEDAKRLARFLVGEHAAALASVAPGADKARPEIRELGGAVNAFQEVSRAQPNMRLAGPYWQRAEAELAAPSAPAPEAEAEAAPAADLTARADAARARFARYLPTGRDNVRGLAEVLDAAEQFARQGNEGATQRFLERAETLVREAAGVTPLEAAAPEPAAASDTIELDDIDRELLEDGYLQEGDTRDLDGGTYELKDGAWRKAQLAATEPGVPTTDAAKLGAGSRVGETKSVNGRTYRLNANHRWERVEDPAAAAEDAPEAAFAAAEEGASAEGAPPARLSRAEAYARVRDLRTPEAMMAFVRQQGDVDAARATFMDYVRAAAGDEPDEDIRGILTEYNERFDQLTRPTGWRFADHARATLEARDDLAGRTFESLHVYGSPLRPLGTWARIPEALAITFSDQGRTDTSAHSYVFSEQPLDQDQLEALDLIPVSEPSAEASVPAADAQALGRSYRVGETKTVNGRTYRLNANHRWERVDDEAPAAPARAGDEGEVRAYADGAEQMGAARARVEASYAPALAAAIKRHLDAGGEPVTVLGVRVKHAEDVSARDGKVYLKRRVLDPMRLSLLAQAVGHPTLERTLEGDAEYAAGKARRRQEVMGEDAEDAAAEREWHAMAERAFGGDLVAASEAYKAFSQAKRREWRAANPDPTLAQRDAFDAQLLADFIAQQDASGAAPEPEAAAAPGLPPVGVQADWTPSQRKRYNQQALELLDELTREGRNATPEEKAVLARYSGEGGIGNSLNEFYTPPEVAEAMWAALAPLGVTGEVLEPSAGVGVLQQHAPAGVRFTAVELDATSARINAQLYGDRGHDTKNASFEQYVADYNDGKRFDAVVGNPPFGARIEGTSRHDMPDMLDAAEYFTLRSLTLTKPGGTVALVVPHGIVSNRGDAAVAFRRRLLAYGDVLSVHGLPTSAFARAGTTAATTDVLIMRARGEASGRLLEGASDEARAALGLEDEAFVAGDYFTQHPANLHGTPAQRGFYSVREGALTPEVLDKLRATKFADVSERAHLDDPAEVAKRLADAGHLDATQAERMLTGADDERKEGKTRISPSGKLQVCLNGRWHNIEREATPQAWARAVALSTALEAHLEAVNNGDNARANELRPRMQALLRQYVSEHGNPHADADLQRLAKHDPRANALLAAVNEDGSLAGAYLEDARRKAAYDPRSISSVAAHLRRTRGDRRVEPRTVFALYQTDGNTDEASLAARLNEAGWYAAPDGGYLPQSELFVGDGLALKRELELAHVNAGDQPERQAQLQATLDALEPMLVRTALEDIPVTPRTPWVDKRLVQAYLGEEYGVPAHAWDYSIDTKGYISVTRARYHADRYKKQLAALERALTGKGIGKDEVERQRVERVLGEDFKAWLDDNGHRGTIEEAYAERAGIWLEGRYDSTPLHESIDGWNPSIQLNPWQSEAANRALAQGGSIIALDVGLGKTFTAIGMVLKAKQDGMAKRPMVAVPKSVISNWRKEFLEAKPDAKLLVVGAAPRLGKDGQPVVDEHGDEVWDEVTGAAALDQQIAQARAGDYDAVLITHTTLGRIPLASENLLKMMEAEFEFQHDGYEKPEGMSNALYEAYAGAKAQALIDAGELSMEQLEEAAATVKELDAELKRIRDTEKATGRTDYSKAEKQRARAEASFYQKALKRLQRKDFPLTSRWESLGVDMLVVDEAHEYKGLWEPDGGRSSVKYLGAGNTSQRALDLYYKTKLLRDANAGRGVHLLTATPVKNSPVELFNMLSYTNPGIFAGLGITNLNQFIDTFCDIQTMTIPGPDGDESFNYLAGMKNLTTLRAAAARWVNRQTADSVGLQLPEKVSNVDDGSAFIAPDAVQRDTIKAILDKPLDWLREQMGFADIPQNVYGEGVKEDVRRELMEKYQLALPHLLRRAELDLEMLDPVKHKGYVSPKVNALLDDLSAALTGDGNGVVVFCDAKDMFSAGLADDDDDEGAPKKKRGKNPNGYSFHEKLADLIAQRAGIPREHIAIANADLAPSADDRLKISKDLEAGRVRVVIGNTGTMGQGMNLQKAPGGVTHMLHLDVPWNAAVLQQREGRSVRQGNKAPRVVNNFYLGKRGYDPIMADSLRGKSNWYDELWNGTEDTLAGNKQSSFNFSPESLEVMKIDDDEARAAAEAELAAKGQQAQAALKRSQVIGGLHALQKLRATLKHHEAKYGHGDAKRMAERAALEKKVARELELMRKREGADEYASYLESDQLDQTFFHAASGKAYAPGSVFQSRETGVAYRLNGVDARAGRVNVTPLTRDGQPKQDAMKAELQEQLPLHSLSRAGLTDGYDDDAYFRAQHQGTKWSRWAGPDSLPRSEAQREHVIQQIRKGAREYTPETGYADSHTQRFRAAARTLFVRRGGKVTAVWASDLKDDDDVMMPWNAQDAEDLAAYLNDPATRQPFRERVRAKHTYLKDDQEADRHLDGYYDPDDPEPNPYLAASRVGDGPQGFGIDRARGYAGPVVFEVAHQGGGLAKAVSAILSRPVTPRRVIIETRVKGGRS